MEGGTILSGSCSTCCDLARKFGIVRRQWGISSFGRTQGAHSPAAANMLGGMRHLGDIPQTDRMECERNSVVFFGWSSGAKRPQSSSMVSVSPGRLSLVCAPNSAPARHYRLSRSDAWEFGPVREPAGLNAAEGSHLLAVG